MTKLWVRNSIGIAVVAAAVAILGVFEFYPPVKTYRNTLEPEQTAAHGASVTLQGRTWKVTSVRRTATLPETRFGPTIPQGASLVAVTIERSGDSVFEPCVGFLTDGHRRWRDQSSSGFSFPVGTGVTEFCSKPGPVQFSFLLPNDVTPTALDITGLQDAILMRFLL